jgi:hypothetical protein
MIKSLKKVRLKKKSFDGENESLHAKFMWNNTVVKWMSISKHNCRIMF